jgi:signal transduction histidine kinase
MDLAEAAAHVAATLGVAGRTAQHELALEIEPVRIVGDCTRIEQIIGNLLTNALKYTPRGGHVRVTVRREHDSAILRVEDSGIGIPVELLPHVFDLFVQGTCSLERAQGGLGIGLTLVRKLVELHGGMVEVDSPGPGQGSIFTVRVPAIPGDDI